MRTSFNTLINHLPSSAPRPNIYMALVQIPIYFSAPTRNLQLLSVPRPGPHTSHNSTKRFHSALRLVLRISQLTTLRICRLPFPRISPFSVQHLCKYSKYVIYKHHSVSCCVV